MFFLVKEGFFEVAFRIERIVVDLVETEGATEDLAGAVFEAAF